MNYFYSRKARIGNFVFRPDRLRAQLSPDRANREYHSCYWGAWDHVKEYLRDESAAITFDTYQIPAAACSPG